MFDKLAAEEARFESLTGLLGTAEVQSDPNAFRKHAKAFAELEPLVVTTFARIEHEVGHRWPDVRLVIQHRVGRLQVGEASVAIAAASPHRANAFAACRYVIERVKQIAPIWKREFFEGGDVWIEGATADPDDARARAEAERIACA